MILDHPLHGQVLDADGLVFAHQPCCQLVRKVGTDIRDAGMESGQGRRILSPVVRDGQFHAFGDLAFHLCLPFRFLQLPTQSPQPKEPLNLRFRVHTAMADLAVRPARMSRSSRSHRFICIVLTVTFNTFVALLMLTVFSLDTTVHDCVSIL